MPPAGKATTISVQRPAGIIGIRTRQRNRRRPRRPCRERGNMRRISAWLSFSLCAAGVVTAIAGAAQTERLIFLSTQLRPIEEAQKMRNLILKGFPREVDYVTEQPQQFPVRIKAEEQGRTHP